MRGIIRVEDRHTHGGRVESGARNSTVMGRAVARRGDACSCPIHGACEIAEGDPAFDIEGRPAAFDGHKTSCGAELISSLQHSGRV
ncbi:TPA: PAAR domain-containing protein [Burkholderia aenigmatica]|uniref:PAAR domain-containing protein n=1 Tax=Burkholderia sp. AU45251 TaxID=3059204 RepID=UPI00264BC113|nr:PAAR domain-containing protein [Burkholderia sp. AU45251]HDR9483888.1 PAAR domain-containing protein [Burkholderia aenigmatica]MDN7516146.1 PAAR domain-containing protein [Burkholderia sp. AU45251]HDR9514853.1 PAAR domain-containing protein [Burkholderia aenigmatica]HDR9591938.1 PAAR domain-containing protein [Burkholderia aenigmatica]HDR9601286.1 PAAR domain-containing protein [Burkholderia aenigmatica]